MHRWQPLTLRGASALVFAVLLWIYFAETESDLICWILSGSLIALTTASVVGSALLRRRLAAGLRVDQYIEQPAYSRASVSSSLFVHRSSVWPFFYLTIKRKFRPAEPASPIHLIKGRIENRFLADSICFPHRGVWDLVYLSCSVGDMLGFSRLSWKMDVNAPVEVSAADISIRPIPITSSSSRSGDLSSFNTDRVGDLFDIKSYDPSDGVRRILWKTFAKSGQLVVRRPEPAIVPEGEIALFAIARTEDDNVAGAVQNFADQLLSQQIQIHFATDGLQEANAKLRSDLYWEHDEIRSALNHSAWSDSAGSGRNLTDFLQTLERGGRGFTEVVIFASETNGLGWEKQVEQAAKRFGTRFNIVLVPALLIPAFVSEGSSSAELKNFFEKLPKVSKRRAVTVEKDQKLAAALGTASKSLVHCELQDGLL